MGELAIIVVNRLPYYFLDFDVPFFADLAAFFFVAIFNYIKNRSYLNFLKQCRWLFFLERLISYSLSNIFTGQTFTSLLNFSASSFEPTIVP
jgi:hypothetical protein